SGRHNGKTLIDLQCFHGEIELTAEFSEVLFPQSLERLQRRVIAHVYWQLTVKLNGRAEAPDGRRGRTLSSGARGAQPPTYHGPFQRLLERNFRIRPQTGYAASEAVLLAPDARAGRK